MAEVKFAQSRRDFLLQSLASVPVLALAGAAAPGEALAAGLGAPTAAGGPKNKAVYTPTFFTKEEYAFISAAVSRLIPADELGPGALEAGVPEYIDRQMQTPYAVGANWYMQGPFKPGGDPLLGYQLPLKPAEIYRLGIAEADTFCREKFGASFADLPPERQDEALELMESGRVEFIKAPSRTFFNTLLQNTREGFFSDPIHGGNKGLVGWKLIGFPGARADFMDWVDRGEKYPFPPVSISGERG
jgi:gluconate 2-dehydrogenase gamma chain